MKMEEIQEALTQLTVAVNGQIEEGRRFEAEVGNPGRPVVPLNESDLRDINKLPDSVKELQVFDGNPVHYISWIHNVENVLRNFEVVRKRPIYRTILQSIWQKIRGKADVALVSYNIFDEDLTSINRCLTLHYADKRDIKTLEYQFNSLR